MKSSVLAILIFALFLVGTAFSPLLRQEKPFEAYEEPLAGSNDSISMVPIKGGVFMMGDDAGAKSETPAHEVRVGDFWMGAFEITWDQYLLFAEQRAD